MTAMPDPAPPAMRWVPRRWVPRRWLRPQWRTVRLRLTLLYGWLFLLSGAGLLAITYALVSRRPGPFMIQRGSSGGAPQAGTTLQLCAASPANPVPAPAQISNCLAFGQSVVSQQHAAELRQLLIYSGIALAIMTVASIGLGWLVAGRALAPLRTITAAAGSISASSLHARLALAGSDDELKKLGDTFDGLLARLEAAFSAQRQFVANASHELRTPLARQRTLVEVALADPQPSVAALQDVCKRILVAGGQQERLIEALLTLASSQRGLDRRELIDLAAITGEVMRARRPEAELRGLSIAASLGPASALGDARLAERLVANLVDNAVRYNTAHGVIEVTTEILAGHAVLSVANTGPLIPPGDVGRLFQPFQRNGGSSVGRRAASRDGDHVSRRAASRDGDHVSSRAASRDGDHVSRRAASGDGSRDGLGLGLSIVAAIAEAHGAWLQANALPGGGLGVQIGFQRPVRPANVTLPARAPPGPGPDALGSRGRR